MGGDIDTLIWIGLQDDLIVPDMSRALIPKFTSPAVVESQSGGHAVPGSWDSTFDSVLSFVLDGDIPPTPTPPPQDDDKPDDDKPDDDKPDDDKPDDDECADDPDFRFDNDENKDCDWVDKKPKSRCDLTWKGKKVSDYCPVTCWACDDWDWDK